MKLAQTLAFQFALAVVGSPLPSALARAQGFEVRVLDALSGKAYNNMPVNYNCFREGMNKIEIKKTATDSNGIAKILYECKEGELIYILTGALDGKSTWKGRVEECGSLEPLTIEQILNVGVISKPTAAGGIWCPAKISKKLKPIPGQIIIFAKKPTWYQKYVAP